jgi:hypothetical protein
VTCCYCAGPVELPERGYPAWCQACDKYFHLAADYGFFTYSVEVYTPKDQAEE